LVPDEIIIIDDHSNIPIEEKSLSIGHGIRVLRNPKNMGRGFSRNLGIQESNNEFIVFCDSSNSLSENFIEKASKCLTSTDSTAVFGKIVGNEIHNDLCSKWREINLFLEIYPEEKEPYEVYSLSTYSVMLRKSHVLNVGNFDPALRMYEDHELGKRILKHGYKILFDPALHCTSNRRDNLIQLATRVDRWYSSSNEGLDIYDFKVLLKTALLIWIKRDIKSKNYSGVIISLSLPFVILFQNIFND
tara:strand:+ start:2947 stop:3684 length:738 start_codon:yes stop_codon:yes gene_type:complete